MYFLRPAYFFETLRDRLLPLLLEYDLLLRLPRLRPRPPSEDDPDEELPLPRESDRERDLVPLLRFPPPSADDPGRRSGLRDRDGSRLPPPLAAALPSRGDGLLSSFFPPPSLRAEERALPSRLSDLDLDLDGFPPRFFSSFLRSLPRPPDLDLDDPLLLLLL